MVRGPGNRVPRRASRKAVFWVFTMTGATNYLGHELGGARGAKYFVMCRTSQWRTKSPILHAAPVGNSAWVTSSASGVSWERVEVTFSPWCA